MILPRMNSHNAGFALVCLLLVGSPLLPDLASAETGPTARAPVFAWMNTSLSADQRADLVLAQMTQGEQLQLVLGYIGVDVRSRSGRPTPEAIKAAFPGTAGYVPGVARLTIPPLIESDAGIGVANNGHLRPFDQTIALPSGIMTAATWNSEVAEQAGAMVGVEARDRGFNVMLGGAMNLAREPRGGRTFEYAGEDPLLAGFIVGAEVRGIQSQHLVSTVKHFAFNDQETGRTVLNARIGEAAARESDLLAFQIAIEQGEPGAVMCAYNRFSGVYACENPFLLTTVLKQQWKYPGWVLSDWGAVHSTVESANAGLDQESAAGSDQKEYFGDPLKQAIADGSVQQARLSDMARRILRSMFAEGLVDYPPIKHTSNIEAHRRVAQNDAEEGIVLLKNAPKLLPLLRTERRIAVIGSHADVGVLSGGGSSQVIPVGHDRANEFSTFAAIQAMQNGVKIPPKGTEIFDPPSPLAEIRAAAPSATVSYDSGDNLQSAAQLAKQSEVTIIFLSQWMAEGRDVSSLDLPGNQDALVDAVTAANPRTIVVLETGGPVLMPWLSRVPAVLEAWYSGSGGGAAIARVLFGDVNPSGKLPITFPQADEQLPRPTIPSGSPGVQFDLDYMEGADVGYRWFQRKNLIPLFPFGYGLSYATFRIASLSVSAASDRVAARVTVMNQGSTEGMETVQIYAAPPDEKGGPGVRRLVGWSKVNLRPGESRRLTIFAEPRLLATFDTARQAWRIAEGNYQVSVGNSSAALTQTVDVHLAERAFAP
jgi:beta-glucosidase